MQPQREAGPRSSLHARRVADLHFDPRRLHPGAPGVGADKHGRHDRADDRRLDDQHAGDDNLHGEAVNDPTGTNDDDTNEDRTNEDATNDDSDVEGEDEVIPFDVARVASNDVRTEWLDDLVVERHNIHDNQCQGLRGSK